MTEPNVQTEEEYAMEQVISFVDDCIEIAKKHNSPEGELAFRKIRRRLDD